MNSIDVIGAAILAEIKTIRTSLKYALELILDPWELIHSEVTEQIELESQLHLDDVSAFYGTPTQHYCMVLGNATHCLIICAHIWPRHTLGKGLEALELLRADIDNPRNYLRLHKSIEKAFDKKRLYFSYVMEGDNIRFTLNILDPNLLNETLSVNGNVMTFSMLEGRRFHYAFVPTARLFLRIVAVHATKAVEKAHVLGWIEDKDDVVAKRERALDLARFSLDPNKLNI